MPDRFTPDKCLIVLSGAMTTPPLSLVARREVGFLIRKLQKHHALEMPHSRSMPSIGARCHELRVADGGQTWRVIYRTDPDAILIAGVFKKQTQGTPKRRILLARKLLAQYEAR